MTPRNKLIVTMTLLLLLSGLGAADYYYSGNEYSAQLNGDEGDTNGTPQVDATLPPGAVAKNNGPEVATVIGAEGLTTSESSDLSLLSQVVTGEASVESLAVLSEGDRAGSVTWVQTGDVKTIFISLKEALLSSFSSEVRDLRDETVQEAGKPVRNILTFFDPSLSEERIVFVRVRERLYEFHIATGKEETMNGVIEGLTGN